MEYNDFLLANTAQVAQMASAYSKTLKNKGFVFVKLDDVEIAFNDLLGGVLSGIKTAFSVLEFLKDKTNKSDLQETIKNIGDALKTQLGDFFGIFGEQEIDATNIEQDNYCEMLKKLIRTEILTTQKMLELKAFEANKERQTFIVEQIKKQLAQIDELTNLIGTCSYREV